MVELYHEYGLPTVEEAIEGGVVRRLQSSWEHDAVFIARDRTKRGVGWQCFSCGAPSERGGEVRDKVANERVVTRFVHEYKKLCALVREGEVLTSGAHITGLRPRFRESKTAVVEKTGFNKRLSFDEESARLKGLKDLLS
jgi:hypothetical protein